MGEHRAMVTVEGGAINSLLPKLTHLLAKDSKQHKHMDKEMMGKIQGAKDELEQVYKLFCSSEEKEKDDQVKSIPTGLDRSKVMMRLRELSYAMEDKVDEFILCLCRPSSKVIAKHKLLNIKTSSEDIKVFHVYVTGNREVILEGHWTFDQIAKGNELRSASPSAAPNVGHVSMKDQLIKLLLKGGDASQQKLRVISILEMEGFEKATLAKQVYCDKEVEQHFNCISFVSMTQEHDTGKIWQGILSDVSGNKPCNKKNLVKKLRETLRDKRYLIIIDDIRRESDWRIISQAFQENNQGSRIMITTRLESLARKCSVDDPEAVYEMHPLFGSYVSLPSTLKACALYLSIFPVNHNIDRDCLVRKWISEGFVLEDEAKDYIDKLVGHKIIQPVECCNNMEVETYQVDCKMLVLLKSISGHENFVTLLSPSNSNHCLVRDDKPVCRLSVHHPTPQSSVRGATMKLKSVSEDQSHIRSLIVFGDTKQIPFEKFARLRVLELEGCEGVEDKTMLDICKMQLLKYLGLKKTQVCKLPSQIKDLTQLETLDVRNTQVTELPKELVQLQKLVNLLMGDGDAHRGLKLTVGRKKVLLLLKVLCTIDLREDQRKVLQKLVGLPELRELAIVLPYHRPADGKQNDELLSSLGKCKKLQSLVIHGDLSCSMEDPAKYPRLLQKLSVTSMFTKVPVWIQNLVHLALLDIRVCKLDDDDLNILRELPKLQSLVLRLEALPRRKREDVNGGEEKEVVEPVTISKTGFSSLKRLSFDCLMPWIYFEEGAMPKLEHLEFKFTGGPATTHEQGYGIPHLASLRKVFLWCLPDNTNVNKTVEAMKKETESRKNITLHIKSYPTQMEMPQKPINGDHAESSPRAAAAGDQGSSSTDTPKDAVSAPAVVNKSKVESKAPGHHSVQGCSAVVLRDICEQEDHDAPKCPLLKSPKLVAEMCGHGVKGLGFHQIQGNGNKFGVVHVLQGSISAAQLEGEFQELVPIKWQWMVKENGHNTFIVEFPSRAQLLKLTKHLQFHLMVTGVIVKVAEWCPSTTAKGQLKTVWVKVGGVPYHVRDYPSLCQVGSLIGSTVRVDISTRRHDTVRIQVAVLDPELIPRTMEVAVDTWLYDFHFEVEPKVGNNEGTDPDDKGFHDSNKKYSEDEIQDRGPNVRGNGSAGNSKEGVFGTKSKQVGSEDEGKASVSDVTKEATATTPKILEDREKEDHCPEQEDISSWHPNCHGTVIRGLKNLGNTCYLNAVLQSLLALDRLRMKMLGSHVPTGARLARSLKELFEKTSPSNDAGGALVPQELLLSICSRYRKIEWNQMQDSHELLTKFLDGLDEEEIEAREPVEDASNGGVRTIVDSIFRGEESTILCEHKRVKSQQFHVLSLAIESTRTVQGCLDLYTQEELQSDSNSWHCDPCSDAIAGANTNGGKCGERNVSSKARKRTRLSKVPPVLTIHLKRFCNDSSGTSKKLEGHVDFQMELDVQPFLMDSRSKENHSTTYHLVAVVEHLGETMERGHYVAYVRSSMSWFHASDSEVRIASPEEVLKCDAYILFYKREGD